MSHRRTEFCSEGLSLNGETLPLYCGEYHYFRASPRDWPLALQAMKEQGLNFVSTSLPWSQHETSKGIYDFSGNRDLRHFLAQVQDSGLHAILRPGPNSGSELTHFGYPKRILADLSMRAQNNRGQSLWFPSPPHMTPIPSYASRQFQSEVAQWFSRLGEEIADLNQPNGPIAAICLDHHLPFLGRSAVFEADYHPDALEWWADFSPKEEAPRAYTPGKEKLLIQWIRFKEEYLRRSLEWLSTAIDRAGFSTIARYTNAPPSNPQLSTLAIGEEALGCTGMDFYDISSGYLRTRRRAHYLAGSSEFPLATEMAIGGPFYMAVMNPMDQEALFLGALAGGVRGFNLTMCVERPRWYSSLLTAKGRVRDEYTWLSSLLQTLRKCEFHRLRKKAPIAVILSRAESRASQLYSAIDGLSPRLADLLKLGPNGFSDLSTDTNSQEYSQWLSLVQDALDLAEIPYQFVDEASLHQLRDETKAVILPTTRRVDGGVWAALHTLASAGITTILGPQAPSQDELGQALGQDAALPPGAGLINEASLSDTEGLAADLLSIAGELSEEWIAPGNPEIDCNLFCEADNRARVLIVGNRSEKEIIASINASTNSRLTDGIRHEVFHETQGVIELPLKPLQLRFMLIDEEEM